jgi:hypothetical protein
MSGLIKSVGKVFKKVAKSKVVKGLAIAAALYYVGGLAAGAMGSTTAANLPGIKGAADLFGLNAGAFGETGPPGLDMPVPQTTPLADTSAPMGTDLTPGPNATAELAANAPAAPPPAAPAPAAPPSPAPVTDKSVPAQAPAGVPPAGPLAMGKPGGGIINSAAGWFQGLSPGAQQILAGSVAGGAAGVMQALAAKNAQEDAVEREQRTRDDRVRRGAVPDFSSGFINRAGNKG